MWRNLFRDNIVYDFCFFSVGYIKTQTPWILGHKIAVRQIANGNFIIECEFIEEHEFINGNVGTMVALKTVNICMDSDRYDQSKLGRYGKTGFLYQIDQPTNPETGEKTQIMVGTLEVNDSLPWITK